MILFTPSVRRHSPSSDLGVIMTALDGGALSLPPQWAGLGEGDLFGYRCLIFGIHKNECFFL
jgi:hypothetical protein